MANFLQIRVEERGLVLSMGFLLLINSLALELADVVAISGFLEQVSASSILIVWVVDMVFVAIATSIQSFIVDRFNRISVMRGIVISFIIAYALLRFLFFIDAIPSQFNYAVLFLLVEQQWIFFPLIFWVLANDVFYLAQAKRLFPLIAAFGFIGQIIGLGLASASPFILKNLRLSNAETLIFNGLLYVLGLIIILVGLRKVKLAEQSSGSQDSFQETISEGIGFVREVLSFRYLTIVMLMAALVVTVVDYHFLYVTDTFFTTNTQFSFQSFYGLYRLGVTIVAILIQTFVTSRLVENFELKNIFILLPFFMIASLGLFALPGLAVAVAGRALFRIAQTSIDEPTRKAFLSLVPDQRRGRVSLFLDSWVFVGGVVIACGLLGGLLYLADAVFGIDAKWLYLGLALVASIVAVWASFRIRDVYDESLLNWRLKKRRTRSSVIDKLDF